jgi:transcriptional regulator with XRE-family HTH domain
MTMSNKPTPDPYTASELRDMLKDRQGGMTQVQFATELNVSMQLLSQIYKGDRSIGNQNILNYLAPKGKRFIHRDTWELVDE